MNKRCFTILVITVVVLLVTACGGSSPVPAAPSIVTPTPMTTTISVGVKAVFVSPGEFYIGRTQQQVDGDYMDCMNMARRTNQSDGLCNPKKEVFGDNPYRKVTLHPGLWVDTTEIVGEDRLPVSGSYDDISAICTKRGGGGRLPTDEEWEIIARYDGGEWPWGSMMPGMLHANIDREGGHPTGQYIFRGLPAGANSLGVENLTGNIAEWTSDKHLRGGGFGTYTVFAKPSHITTTVKWGGGRCVYDIKPK